MTEPATQQDPRLQALQPFFKSCEANIRSYLTLDAQLKAAAGDRDSAIQVWMDTAEDSSAKEIREYIEKATKRLRELAEQSVPDTKASPEEVSRLKVKAAEAEKLVKASSRALRGLADPFNIDVTPMLQSMGDPFLPKQSTGTGSSLPRPSVYVQVTSDDKTFQFENLSGAASHMDIPLEELGKLYAQAGGVPYEEIAKIKEPKHFTWTHTNGTTWAIATTPKPSTRGRQAVSGQQGTPQERLQDAHAAAQEANENAA